MVKLLKSAINKHFKLISITLLFIFFLLLQPLSLADALNDSLNQTINISQSQNSLLLENQIELNNSSENASLSSLEEESFSTLNEITLVVSEFDQEKIIIGYPVVMRQVVTITNSLNENQNINIDLMDYTNLIPEEYLLEATHMELVKDAEIISENTKFSLELQANEEIDIFIRYEFVPVKKEVYCQEKTILDFIPTQAKIKETEVALDTLVEKTCNVRIHHEGKVHYFDIDVPLIEFRNEEIRSIYFVEGEVYLQLSDNTINVPKVN